MREIPRFSEVYLRIECPCVINWRCLMQNKKTSSKEKENAEMDEQKTTVNFQRFSTPYPEVA